MRSRPRSSRRRTAPVTLAAGAATASSLAADPRGFTLVELMLTAAIVATILSMSVPMTTTALDEIRTSMAARYLEGRIMNARMLAVKRSASVALRFEAVGGGYRGCRISRRQRQRRSVGGDCRGHRPAAGAAAVSARAVSGRRVRPARERARRRRGADHRRQRRHPRRLEPHPHARAGRHRHVRHAVSARPARPVRGARARRHRPNSRAQIRLGDGAMAAHGRGAPGGAAAGRRRPWKSSARRFGRAASSPCST